MTDVVLDGVDVRLGGRPVLRDVSLAMTAGEFVGVLGPNGGGKTTLLRTIHGLLPVASGSVRIGDEAPHRTAAAVGYVPQRHDFAWDFPINVAQVVATGLTRRLGWFRRPRAEHWKAVAAALNLVGMRELHQRPIGELSGGQRQRVLVARALVVEPAVLLLDEPFTGVDLPTQDTLVRLFAELADAGVAVVMTTHDLVSAQHTCGRLVLVSGGIVADSSTDDLTDPAPWSEAFGVPPHSAVLAPLGLSRPFEIAEAV